MVDVNDLMKRLSSGIFPSHKNRVWTMCNVTTKMMLQCVEEAEKYDLTNEEFYLNWEDILNKISVKDHSTNKDDDIKEMFYKFHESQKDTLS